jgi:preprotein translocase subunit SecF
MRLLGDTHIDFMKYRKFWIIISLVLIAVFFIAYNAIHLNLGIDFAGGTQLTLRFRDQPRPDHLRGLLAAGGVASAEIQRYGDSSANEVMIKTAVTKGSEEGSRERVVAALNRAYNQGQQRGLDINRVGADAIIDVLRGADPDHAGTQAAAAPPAPPATSAAQVAAQDPVTLHYSAVAKALLAARGQSGLFRDWNAVSAVKGLSPEALGVLKEHAFIGDYAIVGVENVGPQIGQQLRRQGFLAVISALIGMLAYIALRFELRFGIGAVMASIHDVLVTLGLFILMRFEFNLTTIAAFLTLIGYSTNDTVVIFDRMRENMRKSRRKPLIEVMNESINQTLSRTIMTSGLTMLSVAALLVLGGDVLRGFAFVMTVGIIVGTYSSVYVASPFALLWEQYFGTKSRIRGEVSGQTAGRTSSIAPSGSRANAANAANAAHAANTAKAGAVRQPAAAASAAPKAASTATDSEAAAVRPSSPTADRERARKNAAANRRRSGRR